MRRLKIVIRGLVQGVGFRPFVYRLAREEGLGGWVKNSPQGVFIEVEGPEQSLDDFLLRLPREKPPLSFIQSLEYSVLEPVGYPGFQIRRSLDGGEKQALGEGLGKDATVRAVRAAASLFCQDCRRRSSFEPSGDHELDVHYLLARCPHCGSARVQVKGDTGCLIRHLELER